MNRSERTESGLREQIRVIRRRLWAVALVAVIGTGVALWTSSRQHRVFEASAEVAVNQQALPAGSLSQSSGASAQQLQRQVETQAAIAATPAVADAAAAAVPDSGWNGRNLLGHSSVTPSPSADLLVFQVSAPTRLLASQLASAYAAAYTDYRVQQGEAAIGRVIADLRLKLAAARDLVARETKGGGQANPADRQQVFVLANKLQDAIALGESLQQATSVVRPGDDAHQTQPRELRSGLLGALLGIVLGIVLVLLADAADSRVRDDEQVASLLGLPMLARIGRAPRSFRDRQVVSLTAPTDPHAEAYRMLKTAVDLASLRSSARTIMVSSAVAGEGKSTVSANLAVAAAAAGRRVALVDLDLRRPVLAATFGLTDARPDVAAVLNGEAPVANAFHDVDLGAGTNGGSLRVLASRPSQATPSALLEKPALSKLIETLSRDFDLVILDTPPLLSVSDAGVIARTADAILVVVRAGEVAQAALVDTSRLLFSFDVPKLGFVFTDSAAAGGYGYSYGYGAAYGEPRPVAANGSQRPVTAAVGADD